MPAPVTKTSFSAFRSLSATGLNVSIDKIVMIPWQNILKYLQFRDAIFTAFSSLPNTCGTVLGLPSLNTSWLQYFIENSAICVIIGFNASPFSVIVYSTLTGVSG